MPLFLAQFLLWGNKGPDQVSLGPLQPSDSVKTPFWVPKVRVKARVWLSREAASDLLLRRLWVEAFSCKLQPRPQLGGLLLFVEPGRFQDVIAQGKPSFLLRINKVAYGSAL